ncbi:hypothetical protein EEL30_15555 [Brevibacillus laterosporus]|uniref:Uncharacterized protein n=1 Tax=Brevibacillus laterosporus TaxID=1465 RepID=A0A518V9A4_BRELA|nr:hypothetical protein EEL30_15555 [Brevibacillus laterosporus]
MTKRKLPPAKAWREREISDWNTTTFTEFLRDRHEELYGLPYVPARGWRAEQGMIKRMIDEHGAEVTKRFIDGCFREYKPTREYPALTWTFMYVYMRARILPKALRESERVARDEKAAQQTSEELADWW